MRVLFVAMPSSIHAARWVSQIADRGWELHLFGATPTALHPAFRGVDVYGFSRWRSPDSHGVHVHGIWPFSKGSWHLGRVTTRAFPAALAAVIKRVRPDVVHSLEIQHAGYLTLAARARLDDFPRWIVTNWGSDIYYFQQFPDHRAKISAVLAACDYYTCECNRDIVLARNLGFGGDVLGVLPIAGGLDLAHARTLRDPVPPSRRRLIALKGYENEFGRGRIAVRALESVADVLGNYVVSVHLADRGVRKACLALARAGLRVAIKPRVSHEEMLRTFGHARFSIALSVSDGISTTSLEALAMGALPVQSRTSCLDEWARDGETALFVDPEDVDDVARAIRRAATDDALVDTAAAKNSAVAEARLDRQVIEPLVAAVYERAVSRPAPITGG